MHVVMSLLVLWKSCSLMGSNFMVRVLFVCPVHIFFIISVVLGGSFISLWYSLTGMLLTVVVNNPDRSFYTVEGLHTVI